MIAGPLAWVVLGAAAARAGLVPRWVVAGAFLFMIGDSLPIPAAEAVQGLIGLVVFGTVAARILRLDDEAWEWPALGVAAAPTRRSGLAVQTDA